MGDVIDLHAERRRRRPVSIGGIPVKADPAVPEGYAVVVPGGQIVNLATGEAIDAAVLAEFAETGEIKSVSRDRDDADQSPERGDPEAPRRRRLDTGHTRRRTGAP